MNVTCPQCASVFRVDPAKVPERGVRARCSVCSGLIAVRRPAVAAPAVPPDPQHAALSARPSPPPAVDAQREVAPPVAPPPAPEPRAPEPEWAPEPRPEEPVAPPAPQPAPVAPPAAQPAEPPRVHHAPPPVAAEPSRGSPGRFSNPFLQQDPAARARRLARALISDLVVYHPDKRQRGLAEGNLKELFGEEIRKSWEEYAEQVGEDVANTTPYFTDALNDILAEGRKVFG